MCSALGREPYFQNKDRPPLREAPAQTLSNERARRQGEGHMLRAARPRCVKPWQALGTSVRGAGSRTTS
eukprot:4571479-Pyramimonas_sp.AAC.1